MIHVGIAIAILMGSLLLGVSIPFAFGAGTIYMYTMLGGTFATTLPVGFNGINTMVLLAIPTFIMAGGFIEKGKVGDELVSVVEMLVGRFRGGLMLAVSYASAIFGAICGSAAATCSCIGSIMAPKLMRSKLSNEIFHDEMLSLYQQKDLSYQQVRDTAIEAMGRLIRRMETGLCHSPVIETQMETLAGMLENYKGKKVYGYLRKPVKAQADAHRG